MSDPFKTSENTLPEPHSTYAGHARKDGVGKRAFAAVAKLWRPRGTTAEPAAATVSRYAMRLIDRATGKAYAAEEMPAAMSELLSGSSTLATNMRSSLGVVTRRPYAHNVGALASMRAKLERGQDAAAGFIGDSTFRNSVALPYQFATALAERYLTHRVELRQAADNMQSITTTVVHAGPDGRRHRHFPVGTLYGAMMPFSTARTVITGATHFCYECEVSFDAAVLSGSGWPTANAELMGFESGNNRSYLMINTLGLLYLVTRNTSETAFGFPTSNAAIPAMTADVPVRYRAVGRATNGANSTVDYYRSVDQGATWIAVGTQRTSTVTDFVTPANPYWLASGGGGLSRDGMKIYHAQVRINSTLDPILPERMDLWTHGAGQVANTSVLLGSPTIYIDQAAKDGASLIAEGFFSGTGANDFSVEAYRCWTDHAHDFVQINSSHNDTTLWLGDWETQMDAAVTAMLARYGAMKPQIVHTTQNPQNDEENGESLSDKHNERQALILDYAAKKSRGCTDIYQAWLDADNSDYDNAGVGDVHPSADGYAFWGEVFFDCFLNGTNEAPLVAA